MSTALPLTYADLVCTDDLDPFANETTSDLQNLEQDVQHVLEETLGSNLDDLTRGVGLGELLSGTSVDLARVSGLIDSELREDDRIASSQTALSLQPDGSYRVDITLQVDATVLPISYSWSGATGLQALR